MDHQMDPGWSQSDLVPPDRTFMAETEVVDAIVELFTMLLAPEKIVYVRVRKTVILLDQIVELTAEEQQQVEEFHKQSKKQYQLNESGGGFLLRMGRGRRVSAILLVQRVAFPQYIDHYLNVAIRVAGICALAVELEAVAAVEVHAIAHEEVRVAKEIRVDANGGWTCEQAEEIIFYLAKLGVVIVEQPTDIDHVKDWPHLKGKNEDIQLIMDEGMNTLKDFRKYAKYIDGINVKMEKTGGILEAVKLAETARKAEKKVMLGCMVESSVGIAQSVYMSSLADYHDLDAPQLLEDDIAQGITYRQEAIEVDREIIGGPKLKRDVVEKYSNE